MNWIAVQPYYKVERKLNGLEMKTIRDDRIMYLYANKIVTAHREFEIEDVHDLSFRQMGGDEGILYLHTKQGVFSYTLQGDTTAFIQSFRDLT
ncbi:hypothetical protein I6N90_07420 [Paenibacillus sp. GSMTC-2017]|uniref:hypothetical protein n=1 Tax=Paenibacillus sp. GSMTC-2017 TaxID=2794350 RepID=UPI0018D85D32|nr:hypothetical protein [Paenibacillus sp. GSMTC-2017]MBH5317630.1 hypothetical protein [Paenibacillus sp. GSMTC-2017]